MQKKKKTVIIIAIVAIIALCSICTIGGFVVYGFTRAVTDESVKEVISDETRPSNSEENSSSSNEISPEHQDCYNSCDQTGASGVEICRSYCDSAFETEEEKTNCDSSVEDFQETYRNESVSIFNNPCEVIWLLAEEEEGFATNTMNGTTMYITVWRDWENNTTPGTSFSIRALDVQDSGLGIENGRADATIMITRWAPDSSSLEQAKQEVIDAVKKLDY